MKKLLLPLFISAMAVVSASAADFNLTIHGKPVVDGDEVKIGYEYEEYPSAKYYTWDPDMYVCSTVGDQNLTLTIIPHTGAFTCCWPSTCVELTANQPFTVTGKITDTPTLMHIDYSVESGISDPDPSEEAKADFTFEDENGGILSFTLVCVPSELAGVSSAEVASDIETARYDIYGRRLFTPVPGINIVKYADGTVRKIFVNKP
ncbi:MAG: hypothetical protein NC217_08075 [Muribaculaceae bacterium]|nr:hypothetical protein [Muribaculaceae bacterium]